MKLSPCHRRQSSRSCVVKRRPEDLRPRPSRFSLTPCLRKTMCGLPERIVAKANLRARQKNSYEGLTEIGWPACPSVVTKAAKTTDQPLLVFPSHVAKRTLSWPL